MASRREVFTALSAGAVALAVPTAMKSAQKTSSLTAALSAPVTSGAPAGSNFAGTLTLTGFSVVNGVLSATANLVGSILGPAGDLIQSINQTITAAVTAAGSCQILTLTLGPLDLNLLGLVIHLNQVVLNITAVSGAGNLLGNLLCAVANLLNGGGPLQTLLTNLTTVLNDILAAL